MSLGGSSLVNSAKKRGRTAAAAGTPRAIDAAGKKFILGSIKHDLENQGTDGWVYTPFAPGTSYSTPLMTVGGKMPSEILKTLSPLAALYKSSLYKFIVDEESAHFTLRNIVEAK